MSVTIVFNSKAHAIERNTHNELKSTPQASHKHILTCKAATWLSFPCCSCTSACAAIHASLSQGCDHTLIPFLYTGLAENVIASWSAGLLNVSFSQRTGSLYLNCTGSGQLSNLSSVLVQPVLASCTSLRPYSRRSDARVGSYRRAIASKTAELPVMEAVDSGTTANNCCSAAPPQPATNFQ